MEPAPLKTVLEVTVCIITGMSLVQPRGSAALADLLRELLLPLYRCQPQPPAPREARRVSSPHRLSLHPVAGHVNLELHPKPRAGSRARSRNPTRRSQP